MARVVTRSRRRAAAQPRRDGAVVDDGSPAPPVKQAPKLAAASGGSLLRDELPAVVLLVTLYMLQGVPLGLSMGSMPFLMQAKMSYTKIGIFSLASYPYSFKLLWSPVVDSVYWPRIGRRRSWILPLQTASAALMLLCSCWVEGQLNAGNATAVTAVFFLLVLLAATQDVAVDGWALTLLSKQHVGYAATCQTVGMNVGYFASFTVFLALNDASFSNKWLPGWSAPGTGVLSLSAYLRFWGWMYLAITLAVALLARERGGGGRKASCAPANGWEGRNGSPGHSKSNGSGCAILHSSNARLASLGSHSSGSASLPDCNGGLAADSHSRLPADHVTLNGQHDQRIVCNVCEDGGRDEEEDVPPLREAYLQLWRVVRLPTVQLLAAVLVTCRLGMLTAEAAAPLKLLEKGVSKEALAGLVLAEFPMELVSALVAGRWASSGRPFAPWLAGYRARLALAALSTYAVYRFPTGARSLSDAPWAFAGIAALGVATSFTSTLMFTALGSFFNRISDPGMGGAYLTLLNTVANVGVTLPKLFIFAAMDWLTVRRCIGADVPSAACAAAGGRMAAVSNACTEAGGSCEVLRDGFYILAGMGVCVGILILLMLRRVLPRLEAAPLDAWHAKAKQA